MKIVALRVGETIRIGDHVWATVLGVKRNQVRIGVNAPKDVDIRAFQPGKVEQDGRQNGEVKS